MHTSPILLKLGVSFARCYLWLVLKTSKLQVSIDPESNALLHGKQPFILAIWHSRILPFVPYMRQFRKFATVVSAHSDGDWLTALLAAYGHSAIRGSSRKGAFGALKATIKALHNEEAVTITPDGPLGPALTINSNITKIAEQNNVAIITACFSANRAIVLNTWDRFVIPLPCSTIYLTIAPPLSNVDSPTLQYHMVQQITEIDIQSGLKKL